MSNIAQIQADYAKQLEDEAANKSTLYAKFVNSLGSCKFIFADGHEASFVGGVFYTQDRQEYIELMEQCRTRHPFISQVAGEETVDIKFLDPLEKVKREAVAEYIAAQARAIAGTLDAGETDPNEKFTGIGTTATIGAASSGSTSTGGGTASIAAQVAASAASQGTASVVAKA